MNKLFSLLFFVFLSGCLYGQSAIGVKLGFDISNVRNSNQNNFTSLLSYNTGIVFRFKIRNNLLLNTEAVLSNKGFNSELIPSGTTANSLQYLSFPVLAHYCPTSKIYFQIGPEINFLINAKVKNSTIHESTTEDYKKFDCSLAGGIGYKLFRNFNLETRYSLGLSQIEQHEDVFSSYKNRTLQVNLLYLLRNKP